MNHLSAVKIMHKHKSIVAIVLKEEHISSIMLSIDFTRYFCICRNGADRRTCRQKGIRGRLRCRWSCAAIRRTPISAATFRSMTSPVQPVRAEKRPGRSRLSTVPDAVHRPCGVHQNFRDSNAMLSASSRTPKPPRLHLRRHRPVRQPFQRLQAGAADPIHSDRSYGRSKALTAMIIRSAWRLLLYINMMPTAQRKFVQTSPIFCR